MLREVHKRHKFFMHEAPTMIFKLYLTISYLHLQALQRDDGATGKFFQSWLQHNCVIKRNSLKHFQRHPRPSSIAPIRVPFKGRWKLASHGNGKKQEKEQIQSNLIWKVLSWTYWILWYCKSWRGDFMGWWCNKRETNKRDPFPSRQLFNFCSISSRP